MWITNMDMCHVAQRRTLRTLCIKCVIVINPSLRVCSGVSERVKLKRTDYPMLLRIMQGPCEQVCKIFLMEEDLGEEVTYDVNHHFLFS